MWSHNGNFFSKSRFRFKNTFLTIINQFRTKNVFRQKFFVFAIFRQKTAKFRYFLKKSKKKVFKKVLVPSFSTFYCSSFELIYLCVPLTITGIFPSEQIGSPSSPCHQEFMSLVWPDIRTGIGARVWSGLLVLGDDWSYDSYCSKNGCPQRKIIKRKFFRSRDFHFQIRFGPFWIDSESKNFDRKFWLCHFFDQWPRFLKKWLCQVIMGIIFRNRDFHFKLRFGLFWIDSCQKNSTKNFCLPFFDLWYHF